MNSNRRTFCKQLGFSAAGLSLISFLPGCRTVQTPAPARKLSRCSPEEEGVTSAGILAFVEAMQNKHEMHSFVLARNGRVIAEGWWSPYGPALNHTMYSMSKSFASTAVGLAAAEGKLHVNDRVVSFFPDDLPQTVSENLSELRVKHLLSMAVGHAKEPTGQMVKEENWVKTFLAWPIEKAPGTSFLYNSGATYLCSAIVQKVTGQTLLDYLTPRLFEPLGIEGMTWESCPRGINIGGWGLSIQTEGLAKFGQLYLQHGSWNGRQIIPAKWVEEATTFKIQQPGSGTPTRPKDKNDWLQGYCYQFWRSQHSAYRGDGAFGQYTVVMPEQRAVLAMTSETSNMQGQLDLVWEHLLPAMRDKAFAADEKGQAQLRATLSSLGLPIPKAQSYSPLADRVSGSAYKFQENPLHLESASFHFHKNNCEVVFNDSKNKHPLWCGLEHWQKSETALPGTPPRLVSGGAPKPGTKAKVAISGTWTKEDTFEMMLRFYETPHHDTMTCRFEGEDLQVSFMNSLAKMSPTPKDSRSPLHGKMV